MKAVAKTIMTRNLITVPAGSPISEAWNIMEKRNFRHLPVEDESGHLTGILSKRELTYVQNPESLPVEMAMASPVIYVDQNAPLRTAIFKLIENKISSLVISDQNDTAVGIITTDDLLWYMAHLLTDNNNKRFSFSSLFDLQTVGEVARQIANAGI